MARAVVALILGDAAMCLEILVLRLAGVHLADASGSWDDVCDFIQQTLWEVSMLDRDTINRVVKDAVRYCRFKRGSAQGFVSGGGSGSGSDSGSGTAGRDRSYSGGRKGGEGRGADHGHDGRNLLFFLFFLVGR